MFMARGKTSSLPVLHIMLALSDGPRHGYAIKQAVEQRTGGEIRLGPGTLYEAIQRLEDAGLIAETSQDEERVDGQKAQRRYYELTERGWVSLRNELKSLGRLIDAARTHPRLKKSLA
jgi:DNA-binding PadR family transcriptional regulator